MTKAKPLKVAGDMPGPMIWHRPMARSRSEEQPKAITHGIGNPPLEWMKAR
jgi:hypothetical protein